MTNSPHWKGEMESWRWLDDCNVLQVLPDKVLLEFPCCGRTWMEWVPRTSLVGSGADLDEGDCHVEVGVLKSWANQIGLPD